MWEVRKAFQMGERKLIGMGLIVIVLALLLPGQVPLVEAQTYTELRITTYNLWMLQVFDYFSKWTYDNGKLVWSFGQLLDANYERSWYGYTQHADNFGYYWGECVSSVKALSKNNVPTGQDNPTLRNRWYRGARVMNGGVSVGTVIATFFGYGETYKGHVAIFKGYVRDWTGKIVGIEVWDQNWYRVNDMGVFGKHVIYCSGSGVANAYNYYVVLIPS